jgi:hypothetical protein
MQARMKNPSALVPGAVASDTMEIVHDKRFYEGRKAERVGWPG